MQNREYIVFEQTRDTESTSHVRVCESCAHYIFNQLAGGYVVVQFYPWFKFSFLLFQTHYHVIIIHYHTQKQKKRKFEPRIKLNHNRYSFASKEIVVEFACWNNAVKFIASLKQNNSEGFIGSPQILFSFKKSMLNICGLKHDFSRILNWLTRPLNFMQNNVRNFRQNGNSISRKTCKEVKSGFPILYAVEKFGSLLSKDKHKARGTLTPTHDPTLLPMSWENCHGSQPTASTCCVELALKGMLRTTFAI